MYWATILAVFSQNHLVALALLDFMNEVVTVSAGIKNNPETTTKLLRQKDVCSSMDPCPGTDVMILKIFPLKNSAKKLAF
jgi:hypothetical protein